MPIHRTPEPSPPDPEKEANDYHAMDHSTVNRLFVDDLIAGGPVGPQVLDLGCGPAGIPIELCRRDPSYVVMAVDGEVAMLEIAKCEVDIAGMIDRVLLRHADANKMSEFDEAMADTVISNSLLHHLDEPLLGLKACVRLLKPGGRLFIRDLARPDSPDEIERLVERYAGEEDADAQQLLRQSFHAALTLAEIEELCGGLGIDADRVQMTSDRHWTIDWQAPS